MDDTVFRGVKLDLSAKYCQGNNLVWWSFSSATSTVTVLGNDTFLGPVGDRTLFSTKVHLSVNIRRYIPIGNEDDRLILPGTAFCIKSNLALGNCLRMIQLEEDVGCPSLISGFPFVQSQHSTAKEEQERADAEFAKKLQMQLQMEGEAHAPQGQQQVESVHAHADAFLMTIDGLAKAGKLSPLIQGMLKFPEHDHVQEAACEALAGLVDSNDDDRVKVEAEGGIAALLGAMQRAASTPSLQQCRGTLTAEVQEAACRAMYNLAVNPANQVRITAEGGISALVTTMQRHSTNAKLQEPACITLHNLTFDADNQVKAKSAGAEDAVKRAMALQDATELTKEWGQKLLDRLQNV